MAVSDGDFVTAEGLAKAMDEAGGGVTVERLFYTDSPSVGTQCTVYGAMGYQVLLVESDCGSNTGIVPVPTGLLSDGQYHQILGINGSPFRLQASGSDVEYVAGGTWCHSVYGIK